MTTREVAKEAKPYNSLISAINELEPEEKEAIVGRLEYLMDPEAENKRDDVRRLSLVA